MNATPQKIHRRIPSDLLRRMSDIVSDEDRDEMAIPSYLHANPLMRWMAWRRLEKIAAFVRQSARETRGGKFQRIMDFGCGTGVLLDELGRHSEAVVGVDLVLEPARFLVEQWQLARVDLMSPESARRDIGDHSLDAIVAAEVLEHIDPLDDTLEFFRSRLRPDGKLFVSVPTENALYRFGRRLAGFEGHYHESNARAIHRKIIESGFRADRLSKVPAPGPLAIYWVAEYSPS